MTWQSASTMSTRYVVSIGLGGWAGSGPSGRATGDEATALRAVVAVRIDYVNQGTAGQEGGRGSSDRTRGAGPCRVGPCSCSRGQEAHSSLHQSCRSRGQLEHPTPAAPARRWATCWQARWALLLTWTKMSFWQNCRWGPSRVHEEEGARGTEGCGCGNAHT